MVVISQNMSKLVLLNLLILIACIPMIVLYGYYMQAHQSVIVQDMTFSSGIGIGYGIVDNTPLATQKIYDFRMLLFGTSLLPCLMFVGIFVSGLYYCCRNMIWGAQVKIRKHFFRGIKNNWYKFLLSFTWLGILATGFACSLIYILKHNALYGSANAGMWILMILIAIIAFLSAMYMMIGHGMYVGYRFKLKEYINNTSILLIIMFVPTLLVTAFFVGVMALSFINFVGLMILIVMALIGFSVFAVFSLSYSQYVTDNMIGFLYQEDIKRQKKEQERLAKQRNQEKKKKAQQANFKSSKKKK